jgi:hypothetical protein
MSQRTKRTFRILHPWIKPKGILTWQTATEKWHRLQHRRQLMFKRHGSSNIKSSSTFPPK